MTLANSAEQAWNSLPEPNRLGQPEFAYVVNDPALSNVLIYGDSISIDYTQDLRRELHGIANVYRLYTNGRDSGSFIQQMTLMHDTMRNQNLVGHWDFDWDLVHFNVGLHDLKYVLDGKLNREQGEQVATIEQYQTNLRDIVGYLKQTFPEAKLVFATTTPVPQGARGRDPGDAEKYNTAALAVLTAYPDIVINDLFTLTLPNQAQWWRKPGNVHFNATGSAKQAEQVAQVICEVLQQPSQ